VCPIERYDCGSGVFIVDGDLRFHTVLEGARWDGNCFVADDGAGVYLASGSWVCGSCVVDVVAVCVALGGCFNSECVHGAFFEVSCRR